MIFYYNLLEFFFKCWKNNFLHIGGKSGLRYKNQCGAVILVEDGSLVAGEEERCLAIVRRVLDEETVLGMVETFLSFTTEQEMPGHARCSFHSAYLDQESGQYENRVTSLLIVPNI